VEDALRAEVARVAREGVSEAELSRVKTQWIASDRVRARFRAEPGQELGSNWVQGLPLDAEERLLALLRTVTPQQVQQVAPALFWRRPAHRGHAAAPAARCTASAPAPAAGATATDPPQEFVT
jgi:zinc protease